jgi:hypothetical protein
VEVQPESQIAGSVERLEDSMAVKREVQSVVSSSQFSSSSSEDNDSNWLGWARARRAGVARGGVQWLDPRESTRVEEGGREIYIGEYRGELRTCVGECGCIVISLRSRGW